MDFQKLIDFRNRSEGFAKDIGMTVTEVSEGYARVEIEVQPRFYNPIGSIHGGVIFALADTTGGVAASSRGSQMTTVDGTIHYLNPAMGCKRLIGTSREVKVGKTIVVYDARIEDETGKLIAEARMTYYNLHKPLDL